jgi:hypothetical protein
MGAHENPIKEKQNEFETDSAINAAGSFNNKFRSRLKKLVFVTSLAGAALLFNSCTAGYVASEPSYMQYDRPGRPDDYSIWISGDWNWNSSSRIYYQSNGYWEKPRPGKTYMPGHWDSSPKGKKWSKGYWQSENSHKNKNNHDHNHNHNNNHDNDSY